MNAFQYSISRVAEQYRRRIQAGEQLTEWEQSNNAVVRAAFLRYELADEERKRGGSKSEVFQLRSARDWVRFQRYPAVLREMH